MSLQLRDLDLSKLHMYSHGIVIEDNVDNNFEIKVFPIEKSFTDGEDIVTPVPYKPEDLKMKEKAMHHVDDDIELRYDLLETNIPLEKTNFLYATWIQSGNSNRLTPPNVGKGETVMLYRIGNTDKFLWETHMTSSRLRKNEHVLYSYSAKDKITEEDEDLEDTYYVKFSPKNKEIKMHAGNAHNELTTYDITIKTDEGYVELIDGKGNFIKLDSDNGKLTTNINENIEENTKNETRNISKDLVVNTETETRSISKDLTVDTESETRNIKKNLEITLDKVSIKNNTTELISLLCEYLQDHLAEQHIGNLGIPTALAPSSIAKYQEVLQKMQSLKV